MKSPWWPKRYNGWASNDLAYFVMLYNEIWETVATFEELAYTSEKKYFPLSGKVDARYFKLVVTRSHGYQSGTLWCIVGEVGAY